jgi:hypothetical protein
MAAKALKGPCIAEPLCHLVLPPRRLGERLN